MIVGKLKSDRGKWAERLNVKKVTEEKAEIIFHAGCRFSYDEALQKVALTAVNLLKKADVDIGIMGRDESCCGGRAYHMGYMGEFTKFAENNIQNWTTAGAKTIVTSCSDCYHAFKRLYPAVGSKFEVIHTVEFIERLIKEGKLKLKKAVPMTVTYHDPCHLGRQGESYVPWKGKKKTIFAQLKINDPPKPRYSGAYGIYEPPREILRNIPGLALVEMERIQRIQLVLWCGWRSKR